MIYIAGAVFAYLMVWLVFAVEYKNNNPLRMPWIILWRLFWAIFVEVGAIISYIGIFATEGHEEAWDRVSNL